MAFAQGCEVNWLRSHSSEGRHRVQARPSPGFEPGLPVRSRPAATCLCPCCTSWPSAKVLALSPVSLWPGVALGERRSHCSAVWARGAGLHLPRWRGAHSQMARYFYPA